ncbi:MAG: preprotein translocase subunit SecG [Acidobacteria bacterium]|nr:preprotein translocase subunit SecG [Acidobacteriota bacterium]
MLYYILTTIFIITCVFLILVILLQSGKGGDVAAAFGGSGSQTAFGPRGAQKPLEKATVISAVLFMLLALLFSLPGLSGQSSVVKDGGGAAAALPSPSPAASEAPATTASPVASPAVTASPVASASPAASPSPAAKPDKK